MIRLHKHSDRHPHTSLGKSRTSVFSYDFKAYLRHLDARDFAFPCSEIHLNAFPHAIRRVRADVRLITCNMPNYSILLHEHFKAK